MVAIVGTLAAIYLVNPTFGVFEFLPDNIPLLGNLDESTATLLLISALAFFGVKIPLFFQDKPAKTAQQQLKPTKSDGVEEGEIIQE